jgi:hypothetical protein
MLEELMEALEPFDTTMSAWIRLNKTLDNGSLKAMRQALRYYLEGQVVDLRYRYGAAVCDQGLAGLFGIHDTLIRAGKLTGDTLIDEILVYAAHLAAMSSYGPAVWDRAARVVLETAMTTTEKQLAKARR